MSQVLALEWDGTEVRVAVASRHGDHTVIEQAFLIPLHAGPAEAAQGEPEIGPQIAEALRARGIGPMEAVVAVGRGSVELRQLQVPAAADEELPQMVRFQAMLEFNELDEKWLLDFVPVDQPNTSSRTILAAAIPPGLIERIEAVCQRSSLKVRHVVLRSCAAAALLARAPTTQRGQVQLLVELFSDQADLTATIDGKVLFLRTLRRSSEPPGWQNLSAEIRLTMAAMQNQCDGRQVAQIMLCGRGEAAAALAEQIEKETGTGVRLFDPLAGLELGAQCRQSPPEQPGRFAAVLGMVLADLEQAGHAIDFLHPRHAVARRIPYNKRKVAAVAVGVLVVAYLIFGRIEHWWLAREVHQLEVQSQRLDTALVAAEKVAASSNEIAKWANADVGWLDQLRELSEDFPPARQATLSQLTLMAAPASVGGEMQLKGWAQNTEAITALEQSLRGHARRLGGVNSREDHSSGQYSWHFETSVFVGREAKP